MAERSKALRSGRSPLLWAWVRIPLLTYNFGPKDNVVNRWRWRYYRRLAALGSQQQSGAVEACWAHNPEVRRSKLRSANSFCLPVNPMGPALFYSGVSVHLRSCPISAEDSALDF